MSSLANVKASVGKAGDSAAVEDSISARRFLRARKRLRNRSSVVKGRFILTKDPYH